MARRRVTIRDVAADAGVSVTTVSNVLNDVPGSRLTPQTQGRVRESAARLGYAPSVLAQSMRTRRSGMIGLIGDQVATTPFGGKMILGAQDVAKAHASLLLVVTSGFQREIEDAEVDQLMRRQVDGILHVSMFHREAGIPKRLVAEPIVLVNAFSTDDSVTWVVPDEVTGGRDAAQILLAAGHRRLGFINNEDDIPASRGRLEGFAQRAAGSGLAAADIAVTSADASSDGGYRAARALLGRPKPPTGLFCFNDRMAMGAYRAAAELGLRIPQDVSVVGFDDQEYVSEALHPRLTTIALPHYEMGAWGAERLFERIEALEGTGPAPVHLRLRCPVIHRDSVAPPADDA